MSKPSSISPIGAFWALALLGWAVFTNAPIWDSQSAAERLAAVSEQIVAATPDASDGLTVTMSTSFAVLRGMPFAYTEHHFDSDLRPTGSTSRLWLIPINVILVIANCVAAIVATSRSRVGLRLMLLLTLGIALLVVAFKLLYQLQWFGIAHVSYYLVYFMPMLILACQMVVRVRRKQQNLAMHTEPPSLSVLHNEITSATG